MADNNFAPSQGAGGPFALSTAPGILNFQGKRVAVPFTQTQIAANTTTFVFLDGATRAIATSTVNFPGGCLPADTPKFRNSSPLKLTSGLWSVTLNIPPGPLTTMAMG